MSNESCLWKDHRIGRITSSVAHRVLSKARKLKNKTEVGNTENLIHSILGKESPDPNLPALKYGRTVEPVARQNYEFVMREKGHKKVNVKKCGMFVDKTLIFMGSSPDGIVTCECCGSGALEIKCPLSIAHKDPRRTLQPYLTRSHGTLSLKENHQYMTQISMPLSLTGLKWCDFFVYTSKGHFLQRISTESVNKLILELREASELVFYKYVMSSLTASTNAAQQINNLEDDPNVLSQPACSGSSERPVGELSSTSGIRKQKFNISFAGKGKAKREKKQKVSKPVYLCEVCQTPYKDTDDIEEVDNRVGCDNCYKWFHWGCVDFTGASSNEWYCTKCSGGHA